MVTSAYMPCMLLSLEIASFQYSTHEPNFLVYQCVRNRFVCYMQTGLLFSRSHMGGSGHQDWTAFHQESHGRGSGHEITATHPTGCTLTYTMTPTPTPSPSTVYIDHYIDTQCKHRQHKTCTQKIHFAIHKVICQLSTQALLGSQCSPSCSILFTTALAMQDVLPNCPSGNSAQKLLF